MDSMESLVARLEERQLAEREARLEQSESFEHRLTRHGVEMREGRSALEGKVDTLTGAVEAVKEIMGQILAVVVAAPKSGNGRNGRWGKLQHPAVIGSGGAGGFFLVQQLVNVIRDTFGGGGVVP